MAEAAELLGLLGLALMTLLFTLGATVLVAVTEGTSPGYFYTPSLRLDYVQLLAWDGASTVRFDDASTLVGTWPPPRLEVSSWVAGKGQERKVAPIAERTTLPSPECSPERYEPRALAPTGASVAYVAGACLAIVPDGFRHRFSESLRLVAFTPEGKLLVLDARGEASLMKVVGGGPSGPLWQIESTAQTGLAPGSDAKVVEARADALVVGSSGERWLFRTNSGIFTSRQNDSVPQDRSWAALSPTGAIANIRTNGVRVPTWGTAPVLPGASSIAFMTEDSLLAVADRSLWLVSKERPPVRLAFTPPDNPSLLAASRDYAALFSGNQVIVLRVEPTAVVTSAGWALLVFLVSSFAIVILRIRHLVRRRAPAPSAGPAQTLTLPHISSEPPSELIAALRQRSCVLFVGPRLGQSTGAPTPDTLAAKLLGLLPEVPPSLQAAHAAGRTDLVIDVVTRLLDPGTLRREVWSLARFSPSRLYLALTRLPVTTVLTTDWKSPFDESCEVVATPDTPGLKEHLFKGTSLVVKLHGDPLEPDSRPILTPGQAEERLSLNAPFTEFLDAVFASRSVFFIGCDLAGIEQYARRIVRTASPRRHFALLEATGSDWQAEADYLRARFNVQAIPLAGDLGSEAALDFVRGLVSLVGSGTVRQTSGDARAARLVLTNIGPFKNLDLDFDAEWNVLLGDNGVGKSTILKALTLVLGGRDSQPYAQRLLRSGEAVGTISLTLSDSSEYVAEIRRTTEGAELRMQTARPMDAGLLAVGFPPVRSLSWNRVEPARIETDGTPKSQDFLPLLTGELDPRIEGLKAWLLGLESEVQKGHTAYAALLKEFFTVAGTLATGMRLDFNRIADDRVVIDTDDGELALEAISQGAASLLSWVGITLQRMHALWGSSPDIEPRERRILILVDEIDAHMHPAWQYGLLQRLSTVFPNAQFVASTHSPLIVGGLPGRCVKRFVRTRDRQVVQAPIDDYVTLGRADQLLTSRLFGLDTTVDVETQKQLERYRDLASRRTGLDEQESREFYDLEKILEHRIPPPGETPYQQASAMVTAILESQLPEFPDARQRARDAAQRVLDELEHRHRFGVRSSS